MDFVNRRARIYDFNPRLREGGDGKQIIYRVSYGEFQSTPPRGRRPLTGWTLSQQTYFNPRLREGGDLEFQREIGLQHHFNPRLREGGDSESEQTGWGCSVFQSTPPRGRRRLTSFSKRLTRINFNPRLREGGDAVLKNKIDSKGISIHASAREATSIRTTTNIISTISIHASAREATALITNFYI